jgi:uncharacterized protein (DUF1697 family)
MTRYVAFLRAINVGGHTVKMVELRQHFVTLGFANVETFIASGNVLFDCPSARSDELERQIEGHLHTVLGYAVATFLRTARDMADVTAYDPFPALASQPDSRRYVGFLHDEPSDASIRKLMTLQSEIDTFHIHRRELYWHCRTRQSDSAFSGAVLEKTLGRPATLRNVTTVRKIAAKLL